MISNNKSADHKPPPTGRATFRLTFPRPPPPIEFSGKSRPDARVQYYATLYGVDSYANVAHAFGHALAGSVDKLSICNYVGGEIDDPVLAPHTGLNHHAPVGVFFGMPEHAPDGFFEHVIRIGIFVCEADQVLPHWVRICNRFHLIVVPSRFCRQSFISSGVTTPVMVVPHGLHPEHRPVPDRRTEDRFVFYNTLRRQAADRKGYAELLRCFQAAFQGRDDVLLRLHAGDRHWLPQRPGWPDYGGLVAFDGPEPLSMADAAANYSQVHCTVHPSKGEGFGLVPLESMACETPVITPTHTGMADYVSDDNAIVMRTGRMIRAPRTQIQCGRYFSVDEEHLVECLRYAREHWTEERDKLKKIAGDIRRCSTWSAVLVPFVDLVGEAANGVDSWEFSQLTERFRDPGEIERSREEAARQARFKPPAGPTDRVAFKFSNIVYSGWDYPRDGVGNHLRLLDRLIFNSPEVQYKSFEELSASYDPELYPGLKSFVHEQRPDLFQHGLYLDVVGFHGDQSVIRQQIERAADFKRRFNARTAIYLMWESDRLWAPVLELVNAYDLTIVTSSLLEPYLKQRGVRYARLPHPYVYEVDRPAAGEGTQRDVLTIGISAGLWPRKNLALVAETFAEVLGNQSGFRLSIHTRTTPRDRLAQQEHRRIEAVAQDVDNVDYHVCSFSRAEYLEWLRSLDAYCFLSAGEGWSVTPREALHLGKPVILQDAHAHADFSHLPGVIRVPTGVPQPARPGADFIESGIGCEAGVDIEAFKRILADLPTHWPRAKAELSERFVEILEYHKLEAIKYQWVAALNKCFD